MTTPPDPRVVVRSRAYLVLLILAAVIGAPISAVAFGFLALVSKLQGWVFTSLPHGLGFHHEPLWWPMPPLLLAGLLTVVAIRWLPGTGGHSPADPFKAGGAARPAELPGIILAALAALSLGVVLGPEAPLIALGGGLGVCAIRLVKRDAPARTRAVVAAAGSFAAISTLLGSPIVGAFLLMEAAGLGGGMLELVLVPGLVSAGIGALIFTGLGSWSGLGTFSLAIPDLPHFAQPDAAEFGWALVIGVLAAVLGSRIRWLARYLRPHVERRMLLLTLVAGLAVAGLAIAFAAGTGKGTSEVLFSGQTALGPLVTSGAGYTVNALLLLLVCKALAYSVSMSSFRGGPVFPGLFIGAVGGMLMSHLPGLPLVAGVAMGMGAMSAVLLELPLTSVLLATLILGKDGLAVMPLVIVAVVVAYMLALHLTPASKPAAQPGEAPPGAQSGAQSDAQSGAGSGSAADSGSGGRTGSRPVRPG